MFRSRFFGLTLSQRPAPVPRRTQTTQTSLKDPLSPTYLRFLKPPLSQKIPTSPTSPKFPIPPIPPIHPLPFQIPQLIPEICLAPQKSQTLPKTLKTRITPIARIQMMTQITLTLLIPPMKLQTPEKRSFSTINTFQGITQF